MIRVILALVFLAATLPAFGACKLEKFFELPVTMFNLRPIVTAKINGEDARFVLDSGDWYSQLTPAAAAHFGLKLGPAPFGLTVRGIGGEMQPRVATVKSFALSSHSIPNLQFLVGGNELGLDAAGLLGQNVLHIADVEYDLANGIVRLMQPKDCGRNVVLAYWLSPGQAYSVLKIEPTSQFEPHTRATAFLNGKQIRVMFDSGAPTSAVSREAAEAAGIKLDAAGVTPARVSFGIGRTSVRTWIAPFESFKIGGEEVRNTRLRIMDQNLSADGYDMLLGDDFLLSHRMYVAMSQDKLYFTYNGGGVFKEFNVAPVTAANKATEAAPSAPTQDAAPAGNTPADAADLGRRGGALMARHEYSQAIAELTRACELAPNEPLYFYQRAMAYLESQQLELGKADIDHAIELKPDYLDALMVRIQLHLSSKDAAGASVDLEAADRAAPKQFDGRLMMANAYDRMGQLPQAIGQFDLWIDAHPDDIALASALNGRCWVRALLNQDLDRALQDCDAAIRRSERGSGLRPAALDSRGFVYLRRGDYRRAIADYDEALKQNPKLADSLYGRGLAELHSGMSAAGQKDLVSAAELRPNVADTFTQHGLTP